MEINGEQYSNSTQLRGCVILRVDASSRNLVLSLWLSIIVHCGPLNGSIRIMVQVLPGGCPIKYVFGKGVQMCLYEECIFLGKGVHFLCAFPEDMQTPVSLGKAHMFLGKA